MNPAIRVVRSMLRSLFRLAYYFLLSLGLLVVVVIATPLTIQYGRVLAGPWNDPDGDILIVLAGGDSTYDGIMGDSTYLRCVYAVRAFREGSFRRVVVSGARTAYSMRDFLVYHGVPSDAIQIESRSESTRENALFVRELLSGMSGTRVLLTSDYHMFRATRAFRQAGVAIEPRPFPDAIKRSQRLAGRMPAFINEAMESTKIVYYFARGWI